ncbi:triose-phosphate isomerase [Candidatus Falkowbacteria bacterium]|nr:triose-phosphate isomerase [Candidatus Falkowbacteria bacterium]
MKKNKTKKSKIVIANWKMQLSLAETMGLAKKMKEKFSGFKKGEIAICPNLASLRDVEKILKGSPIKLGAQNVFWEEKGAYTGEVSASMLKEASCRYVIIGHSERRKYLLENYEIIYKKTRSVLNTEGLTPIVCIGESWNERMTDRRDFVLVDQLQKALGGLEIMGKEQIIIAYEPIWAIGTGSSIEPSEAEYAHKIIKLTLRDMFNAELVKNNFRVVYGGSISGKNVKDFAGLENLDGLLVGGASLDADEFYKVAKTICLFT